MLAKLQKTAHDMERDFAKTITAEMFVRKHRLDQAVPVPAKLPTGMVTPSSAGCALDQEAIPSGLDLPTLEFGEQLTEKAAMFFKQFQCEHLIALRERAIEALSTHPHR